ncbi:hypothetical protein [Corynebacterium stationis]|uniref:hypothetical protein n=1 Tax=Corynebacterium stationis TaxID=1705 RepID=UPI0017718511|nr:hypothetical protein [Corynebacterium stationis]HHT59422.1 hypothetical protein [Corynebacterium stationis]
MSPALERLQVQGIICCRGLLFFFRKLALGQTQEGSQQCCEEGTSCGDDEYQAGIERG